jgi:hypothetical protein
MHWEINWRTQPASPHFQDLRSAAGFLLAALGVGAVLLLLEFNQGTRVLSDPALQPLEHARTYLDQSQGLEQRLLQESRSARQDLEAADELLSAVEKTEPSASGKIDGLRTNLAVLETRGARGEMPPEELEARFRKVLGRMKDLIDTRRALYR